MSEENTMKGGGFMVWDAKPGDVFIPEEFTSEQLMLARTAREFTENEVLARSDEIEQKDYALLRELLAKAGELGLLMADVPEEYGGLALDKISSMLINEMFAVQGSFSVTRGGHIGIGMLPIVYYGTEAARKKYLPEMSTGRKIGCYCLTEPTSGSDALSARTKATRDGDDFVINGTKQFITNGAIADVFIVFAKVDGEHFTGFICEKGMEGLSIGAEEHKMGIRGTSTTTVNLDDVRVPAENLLGEIGKGHKIAFNILNIGRFKLGIGCVGSAKKALDEALIYALQRKQFNTPIAQFGMIREKLANMYARTWAAESAAYRIVGMIQKLIDSGEGTSLQAIEEYSVECAIIKVLGSEVLDYVVDEAVQTHGGYGYIAEYGAERYYRDSRINRIFEGTNEINRLLIPAMLMRKGMKGELPLFQAAKKLTEELMEIPSFGMDEDETFLAAERKLVGNLKKIGLFVAGVAAQKYGKALEQKQPVLARIADLAILAFSAESAVLRALKLEEKNGKAPVEGAAARIICEEAITKAEAIGREALCSIEDGDTLRTILSGLKRLTRRSPADTIALREELAAKMVEEERAPFIRI